MRPSKHSRWAASGIVLAIVGFALAACGGGSSPAASSTTPSAKFHAEEAWAEANLPGISAALVSQACTEGHLMLYAQLGPSLPALEKEFGQHFPCIKIASFQAGGSPLTERFQSEEEARKYIADIVMNSSPALIDELISDGYLAKYVPPNSSRVPQEWQDPGYYYAFGVINMVVSWNSKTVTPQQETALKGIKTWQDVLKIPGMTGKGGVVSVQAGGTDELAIYFFNTKYGPNYLKSLESTFKPTVYDSASPSYLALSKGTVSVLPYSVSLNAEQLYFEGAPIQWVFPTPSLADPLTLSISANAPDPAAARLFETWSLTAEGQEAYVKDYLVTPANPTVPNALAFTKEPWFHAPSTPYYVPPWLTIEHQLSPLTSDFTSVFG
jgi:iron(III) transport system substrate-binding protein